jgi:gamma-glutamyl hydrolase
VFPGGLTWLWLDSPYVIAARKLFDMAVASNDAGDPFPIWGTCLGHQLLQILATNISRNDLLVETDAVGHPTTLEFVGGAEAAAKSVLFKDLPKDLIDKLSSPDYNIAIQNHMYGVPPSFYKRWPELAEWYSIVSTTKDRNGLEYISTIEGKKYPFFGTQWHPEKPPFEFTMDEIPHTIDAIRVSQHLANAFVDVARKSSHEPPSREDGLELQIYDTCPIFAARFEVVAEDNYDGPDQYYCFDKKASPPIGPDDAESDEDGKKEGGHDAPPSAAASGAVEGRRRRRVGEDGHEAYSRRTYAALRLKVGGGAAGEAAADAVASS